MTYDYSKLIGRIVEKYQNRKNFAAALGISEHSLSEKLNNNQPFKQREITKAIELLGASGDDICGYFFTQTVQNN